MAFDIASLLSSLGGGGSSTGGGAFSGVTPGAQSATTGIGGAVNQGMNFMKEKPEVTSMILDYLGSSLAGRDEGNIASGLGTMLAKSSLNEKALRDVEQKNTTGQQDLIKVLTDLIGGKLPGPGSLTPGGKTGITKVSAKPDALGGSSYDVSFDTEDSPGIGPDVKAITPKKETGKVNEEQIYETLSPNFLMP